MEAATEGRAAGLHERPAAAVRKPAAPCSLPDTCPQIKHAESGTLALVGLAQRLAELDVQD